jgi:hypothetical protein
LNETERSIQVSIVDLYQTFEVKRACEILARSDDSREGMVCQLVTFNMLMAWALWPEDEAQRKVRRAARVTVRSIMIELQVRAEKEYLLARQSGAPKLGHQRAANLGPSLSGVLNDDPDREYTRLFDQVILPLGGSRLVSRTVSDAAFRREIAKRWKLVQFVALMADFLIRHAAAETIRKPSINKAAYFVSDEGYGAGKTKNPASLKTLWAANKAKAPLLCVLWRVSPNDFLLRGSTNATSNSEYLRNAIQGARQILDEASWARARLLDIDNIRRADPQFAEIEVSVPSSPQQTRFVAEPLSAADRAKLYAYRAPKTEKENQDARRSSLHTPSAASPAGSPRLI